MRRRTYHRRIAVAALAMATGFALGTLASAARAAGPAADAPKSSEPATPSTDPVKEAETHFRRGVELYKDNDYGGAIVEFRRAYELAPNYRVLFNLGQTYFQLQRYAEALATLQAFLSEGGAQIAPDKRASVEADVKQLENRVGQVEVRVNADGAQVLVDDQPVGTSPLANPIPVSVGHRKVAATKAGAPAQERFVDVAAGDHVSVSLEFPTEAPASPLASASVAALVPAPQASAPPAPPPSRAGAWIAWGVTGLFGAATAVTGFLALSAKSSLSTDLNSYPGNADAINGDRTHARTFGVLSDALLGATVVAGGIAIVVTVSGHSHASTAELGFGPAGIQLRGRY